MRAQGILALAPFRSDTNVKLLKPYLNDLGVEVAAWGEYPATRKLIVRSAAYKVLTGWGIAIPKPSTDPIPLGTPTQLDGFAS